MQHQRCKILWIIQGKKIYLLFEESKFCNSSEALKLVHIVTYLNLQCQFLNRIFRDNALHML